MTTVKHPEPAPLSEGTEKQVAWATDIRERLLREAREHYAPYLEAAQSDPELSEERREAGVKLYNRAYRWMASQTRARYWIDNQSKRGYWLLQDFMQKVQERDAAAAAQAAQEAQ